MSFTRKRKNKIFRIADLSLVARKLLSHIGERPVKKHATLVALQGELGAGKTTFVKAVARTLGIKHTVTSPTFILLRVYKIPKKHPLSTRFTHLTHIDAYRLKGASELGHLGWRELVKDPKNIIFIEWAERVKGALPKKRVTLRFTVAGEKHRRILWQK